VGITMANRKALKQKKKRWLKRAFKTASKVVTVKEVNQYELVNQYPEWILPAPIETEAKHKERTKAFQDRLDTTYGGTVTALTNYVNDNCSMTFKCNSCGIVFFGKAGQVVGKDHQRHECGMPLGDRHGVRLSYASSGKPKRNKNNPKLTEKRFQELVWADLTPEQIAKELQINPNIIKDYFVEEGLIEEVPKGIFKEDELTFFKSNSRGRRSFKDGQERLYLECSSCTSIKYIDDFTNNKGGFYNKHTSCKECENKKDRQKRAKG
jgi:hypothetical protein